MAIAGSAFPALELRPIEGKEDSFIIVRSLMVQRASLPGGPDDIDATAKYLRGDNPNRETRVIMGQHAYRLGLMGFTIRRSEE